MSAAVVGSGKRSRRVLKRGGGGVVITLSSQLRAAGELHSQTVRCGVTCCVVCCVSSHAMLREELEELRVVVEGFELRSVRFVGPGREFQGGDTLLEPPPRRPPSSCPSRRVPLAVLLFCS